MFWFSLLLFFALHNLNGLMESSLVQVLLNSKDFVIVVLYKLGQAGSEDERKVETDNKEFEGISSSKIWNIRIRSFLVDSSPRT